MKKSIELSEEVILEMVRLNSDVLKVLPEKAITQKVCLAAVSG